METKQFESLVPNFPNDEDERYFLDHYDLRLPDPDHLQIFPCDFQVLNSQNKKLVRDEVLSYLQQHVLVPKDREDIDSKFDTFKIESVCRRVLKDLVNGFQEQHNQVVKQVNVHHTDVSKLKYDVNCHKTVWREHQ